MEVLLDAEVRRHGAPLPLQPDGTGEAQARRSLRRQVARLESRLADTVCAAFPETLELNPLPGRSEARILDLGELEELRDHLIDRLGEARRQLAALTGRQEEARARLERMLLDPAGNRRERISQRELGEPGCGVWSVAPRVGIIGRMMGWWQVKLSSGCPLAT
ncbi:MAG: hypothetical protein ACKOTA_02335 [Solirubrobacterales bacterium]